MIYPKFLNKNCCIGVPAPSDGSCCEQDIARYKNAKKQIENLGFNVELSKNIYNSKRRQKRVCRDKRKRTKRNV